MPNGRDKDLRDYLVTVQVERYTTVRARSEEEARKMVIKKQEGIYGSGCQITVTGAVPC